MSVKIIKDRLKEYAPRTQREELNALKEIFQEIALCALSRADFFNLAAFQGGSCLRIVHKIRRFSEDLDFILFEPDKKFVWEPFLKTLQQEFTLYDLKFEVVDRSRADKAVKAAFLKDTSFGKIFVFTHTRGPADQQVIKIKLEVDTNPPAGSDVEKRFVDFPYAFSIVTQDLPSLFASKCHAILCRRYAKGRDWFDFAWYVSKGITPNYIHLTHAINQEGPWKGQGELVTREWLGAALTEKIKTIDWASAKGDAENFLRVPERESLKVWGQEYFGSLVKRVS